MLPDLTLTKLRKILRLHYREKTASELYQELSVVCQNAKESPQQFLLHALGLRNKVQSASQEADSKFEYGFLLIQNTFLKSTETGLLDDILVTNFRPALHNTDLSNEDLMKYVNELATDQAERQSKLGSKPERSSAAVAITEPTQPKQNAAKESSQQNDLLLAEIREIKSDLSTLKQHVNFNHRPANRQSRGWSQGRGCFRGNQNGVKRGCKKCQRMNTGDFCNHCFICGASDHYRNSCPKENSKLENRAWLHKGDCV